MFMKPVVKVSLLAGCIFGAVVGIAVALSIDFMTGEALGGGWYESVKHDVGLYFGPDWAEKSWAIYSGVVIVIIGIGVIGALIGAFFGAVTGKFLSIMTK
jgi:predicted membrane protein